MTIRRASAIAALTVAAAAIGWLLFVGLPRWYGAPATSQAVAAARVPPAAPSATAGRRIKAHLLYVAEDGLRLTSVEREVAYGEGTMEQARQIVEAQIAPVADPLVSAIPPGTRLRALFVTDRGEAYVDLTREIASAHSGGTTAELLTVYSIVDAITVNLPAVTSVQVLVDGKEVETLAGQVDLRRPLGKNLSWIE
jgi:spore germination protein GerM